MPLTRENLSWGCANNKGADQPAHPHSLISAFVIHYLESKVASLLTCKISIFYLVSVAEQTSFESHFFGNNEDGFCRVRHILNLKHHK